MNQTINILIVDDNIINVDVLKISLMKTGTVFQLSIDTAFDGSKAVEMAQNKPYDIIFMDLQMPVMSGFEASRKIREHEVTQQKDRKAYILALTATQLSEKQELIDECGVDDVLLKPFSMSGLTDILNNTGKKIFPSL